jgi:hypothetical protein
VKEAFINDRLAPVKEGLLSEKPKKAKERKSIMVESLEDTGNAAKLNVPLLGAAILDA